MDTDRRGFLGALVAAAVVGPKLVEATPEVVPEVVLRPSGLTGTCNVDGSELVFHYQGERIPFQARFSDIYFSGTEWLAVPPERKRKRRRRARRCAAQP